MSPIIANLPSRAHVAMAKAAKRIPGTGLAALIALAATFVSELHGGPQLLYALLFGVAFHYLSHEPRTKAGIDFASRTILRLGVGLLGARITVTQIASLGWTTALIVMAGVASTLAMGFLLARGFGMTRPQGLLSGGSVAICGASAALAISAVLPPEKNGDRFTLMVVVTVTVMSTVAMVVYPLVAKALDLPPELAGLFLGGTIHDVAQVVGAGYMMSNATGDVAIVVKLFRVSMLALVVFVVAAGYRKCRRPDHGPAPKPHALVPWFLWLFVAMVGLGSLGAMTPLFLNGLNDLSRACMVVAIAALGMKTSFVQLARAGWRPFALIMIETLWLAALVLGLALLLR
jgi:uncharacterized integral membrane protein (TIGR00698 family)